MRASLLHGVGGADSQLPQSELALPNPNKQGSPLPARESGHVALCHADMRAMHSGGRSLTPCDADRDGRLEKSAGPTALTRHTSTAFGYFSRIKDILLGQYQLDSPLVVERPIMNAIKYRVVSGVVWTNRTMAYRLLEWPAVDWERRGRNEQSRRCACDVNKDGGRIWIPHRSVSRLDCSTERMALTVARLLQLCDVTGKLRDKLAVVSLAVYYYYYYLHFAVAQRCIWRSSTDSFPACCVLVHVICSHYVSRSIRPPSYVEGRGKGANAPTPPFPLRKDAYQGSTSVDLCFTAFGVGPLVFVRGSMNTEAYCNILDIEMLPTSWRFYGTDPCYLQDDNPAQSPGLDPIENIWDELDGRVRVRQARPKSIAQLMEWLQDEWRRIPVDVLQTLVESMLDRLLIALGHGGQAQLDRYSSTEYRPDHCCDPLGIMFGAIDNDCMLSIWNSTVGNDEVQDVTATAWESMRFINPSRPSLIYDGSRIIHPHGATVVERLARSPPTTAGRAQYPAGPQDFRKWESCRTMPLVGGAFSGISRFPPPFIPAPLHIHLNHPYLFSRPRCKKKKSNLFTHSRSHPQVRTSQCAAQFKKCLHVCALGLNATAALHHWPELRPNRGQKVRRTNKEYPHKARRLGTVMRGINNKKNSSKVTLKINGSNTAKYSAPLALQLLSNSARGRGKTNTPPPNCASSHPYLAADATCAPPPLTRSIAFPVQLIRYSVPRGGDQIMQPPPSDGVRSQPNDPHNL
ncbi:hypothetical protein PR048_031244 [Dryococelus australis]|uniref:Uncharacterized protein n=1 Tax=Dryococelus australis TaxID=614101 RepID=A0ABQ9G4S6_9NEOP|nr:hypothetical protein PR048_031244 [Dryococelus australis]